MAQHKKSFNVDVDSALSDAFSAQVDERGYTKYRAIEGALRAYMAMPTELQVRLISATSTDDIYTMLVELLLEAEILHRLDGLGPAKAQFLEMLSTAKARTSQKM